jgi:6-phosphogluconate dehydrogenase
MQHQIFFFFGVSGCGKTTIGRAWSIEKGIPFYDADSFHSKENVAKMQSGQPLNDADRLDWLQNINTFALEQLPSSSMIFACSALKETYRQRLMQGCAPQCQWIFLDGNFDLIKERLAQRTGHFMPSHLLQSQFDILEIPDYGQKISIAQSVEAIILQLQAI